MRVFRVAEISSDDLMMWVDVANHESDAMIAECARTGQSHSEYLGQRFAMHDLVYGVWPDKSQPDGVGAAILKGAGKIQMLGQHPARDRKFKVSLYVTRNSSKLEAAAMAQVWGDDRADGMRGAKTPPGMPSTGGHLLSMSTKLNG